MFQIIEWFKVNKKVNNVKRISKNASHQMKCHLVNLAIQRLGISKDNSSFLGDSLDDVNAAGNARIRIMIITDGENGKEDILAAKPDQVIQSYDELLRVV